ncbi:hypothetical protein J4403_02965 [Candidatus Woesearchaeota archaeon]|nr:hypothetical protein [Candidatus Woesearchaeota archaeon]
MSLEFLEVFQNNLNCISKVEEKVLGIPSIKRLTPQETKKLSVYAFWSESIKIKGSLQKLLVYCGDCESFCTGGACQASCRSYIQE